MAGLIGAGGFAIDTPPGEEVGGTFDNIPLCSELEQTGCVIAYTTFNVLNVLTLQEVDDLGLTPLMDVSGNVALIDILQSTDELTAIGLLYDSGDGSISSFEQLLRLLANDLYTAINEGSDI